MFKIPEWGEDVPKNNINMKNPVSKGKKIKQTKTPNSPNSSGLQKTKFKAKIKHKVKKAFKKKNGGTKTTHINQSKDIKNATKKDTKVLPGKNSKGKNFNNKKKENLDDLNTMPNYDTDALDEIIINNNKKKLNNAYQKDDNEKLLFNNECSNKKSKLKKSNGIESKVKKSKNINQEINSQIKVNKEALKKQYLKDLLQKESHRNAVEPTAGSKLRERMMERLNAAKFRYLNEKLYTSSGSEAQQLFQSDPSAFQTYHQGYQQQIKKWPVNPLDVVVKRIQNMPKNYIIADMGCGEAALSSRVPHTVRSFDLVANAPCVEICDMAHTPLLSDSVNVAVYCLALMGTDLTQYLVEANRVLKIGGHLLIAEVESRFNNVEAFTREVQKLGFNLKKLDKSHKVFFFMEFTKVREAPVKKSKLPILTLKPCIYKRR